MFFLFRKELADGDVNENDKRSRGLSQDDEEEDDEDEDIPGERFLPVIHSVQSSRLFILSFLLFTEELKLDYVDEKTGEIPLSRFGVLGCLSSFRETTGMAIQIKDRIILQHSNIHQFIHRMSMCLKSSCPVDQYISLFSCPH